jgi:cytochrome P450
MDPQVHQISLTLLVLFFISRLYQYSKLSSRPIKFPPGPKTLPFIGNLHQIPISRPELKFAEFANQFGDLTGLKAGRQSMIVLNTWQAVRDLIEHKGSIYSSRPSLPVFDVVIPGGLNPVLNAYGDLWRRQRKVLVEFLGGERSDRMKPVQDAESTQMVYDILHTQSKFQDHISRSFGAVIMETVFGQRVKTFEPGGKIDRFFKVEEDWAAAVGPTSSPPINSFPFLEKVPDWLTPWNGWRERARRIKKEQEQLYLGLLNETRERLARGKGVDCFMAQCLRSQDKEWYDDTYLGYLGGVLLEGGAETSASTTIVFIMAMAAFPEVLRKAQEEVDRICGVARMPGKDDTNKLPYIRACMSEVLRWRPITPLAIAHHTSAEDTYQKYKIPAGTDIIINTWRIHHDESSYDSPSTFNPSRFLRNEYGGDTSPVKLDSNKGRRTTYAFGAGRRVCPGQRFAENTMMMHFAKLVWAFDIERTGELPVHTWEGWTDGVITKPKRLNVRFQLRDEGRRNVIEDAWVNADEFLRQYED